VILLQLIIGSAIMFGLGTIGLYLARIYDEIKARPRYLIEQSAASTVDAPGTASPIF
jgi:hypothetical protein